MVLLRVNVAIPPAQREHVLASLRATLGPTRVASGCLSCQLMTDAESPARISYIEEWQSREHLNAHYLAGGWRVLLSVLDLATSPPGVRFETVASSEGLELLSGLRRTAR